MSNKQKVAICDIGSLSQTERSNLLAIARLMESKGYEVVVFEPETKDVHVDLDTGIDCTMMIRAYEQLPDFNIPCRNPTKPYYRRGRYE